MKGRPPGTPKSVDPNKKKRKRTARERDLCDVKIKITEHLPSASSELGDISLPGVDLAGQHFWTIQRVNGNGGNGKGDGVAGPHKHTLQRSDDIKKSSVQRYLTKQGGRVSKAKEKANGVRILSLNTMLEIPLTLGSILQSDTKATGAALATIRKHAKDNNFKLYAACFWYGISVTV
jgi:glutathione S-transferase